MGEGRGHESWLIRGNRHTWIKCELLRVLCERQLRAKLGTLWEQACLRMRQASHLDVE